MTKGNRKKDRTARLLREELLLWQYTDGIEMREMARKCLVSERTIYRDMETLASELDVPIWEKGTRRGLVEGHFLFPISLSPSEAMSVFISARLIQNIAYLYMPSIVSTFMKLSTIVQPPLRQQLQNTLKYLEKQPRDERKITNFEKITKAWLTQHRIKFRYRELCNEEPAERLVETYSVEPGAWGRSTYMIGYCHLKKTICNFKIDLINGDVLMEPDTYEIPASFNTVDYLGSGWGIYVDEPIINVILLFGKKANLAAKDTVWHPSQTTKILKDGSILMNLRIRNTVDFRGWILGWGDAVEVLEPVSLRNQIIRTYKSGLKNYVRTGRQDYLKRVLETTPSKPVK